MVVESSQTISFHCVSFLLEKNSKHQKNLKIILVQTKPSHQNQKTILSYVISSAARLRMPGFLLMKH